MKDDAVRGGEPNRADYLIALAVGLAALAAYVRTLAPDVLYGDSAEFQTLAYTLGMTHSTGYPIYLLLARLLGFLPIGTAAWRVNLLSAVAAAATVGGVYLLARHFTRSRAGALLGAVGLGLSYTFWSQAIIAEVYTPATAFLSAIILLLWRWHGAPLERWRALLVAALLAGLGLGVHASVALIGPPAALFVLWNVARRVARAEWWRCLAAAFLGLAIGAGAFLLAFLLIDLNHPPTSFYQVALYPSRSIWGLQATDLDTPGERFLLTVLARQWQGAVFPGGLATVWDSIGRYAERLVTHEFPHAVLWCALLGLAVLHRTPGLGGFALLAFATALFFILGYEPPDKHVFFLPTYLFLTTAAGAGAGYLVELVQRHLPAKLRHAAAGCLVAALGVVLLGPVVPSRQQALQAGAATFVQEHYVYPLYDLAEPRRVATQWLDYVPEDAVLILDWRALYTTYYLAHVELGRMDLRIMEATPHGSGGMVADSLIGELQDALRDGRLVYAERLYKNLPEHFRTRPVPGTGLIRLLR